MKNFVTVILMFFTISMFIISCGGDEDDLANDGINGTDDQSDCSVEITPDSCIEAACTYEWNMCKENCECIKLHECDLDCYECSDAGTCDEGDCLDNCMSQYPTGTSNMVDIGQCLQANNECPDSRL